MEFHPSAITPFSILRRKVSRGIFSQEEGGGTTYPRHVSLMNNFRPSFHSYFMTRPVCIGDIKVKKKISFPAKRLFLRLLTEEGGRLSSEISSGKKEKNAWQLKAITIVSRIFSRVIYSSPRFTLVKKKRKKKVLVNCKFVIARKRGNFVFFSSLPSSFLESN